MSGRAPVLKTNDLQERPSISQIEVR